MNTLELLTTRRSSKQLTTPAPNADQLHTLLQAATQVPDHGLLTPYRFIVIQGDDARARFADTLHRVVVEENLGEEGEKKAKRVGNMAPLVIGVIASIRENAGKPEWEQLLTAGCSAYAIQLAAKAQGFDNVWISGKWVDSGALRQAFACQAHERIIALLMIGTAQNPPAAQSKNTEIDGFTTYW